MLLSLVLETTDAASRRPSLSSCAGAPQPRRVVARGQLVYRRGAPPARRRGPVVREHAVMIHERDRAQLIRYLAPEFGH